MPSVSKFGKLALGFRHHEEAGRRLVQLLADIRKVNSGRETSKVLPFYENIDNTE